MKGPLLSAFGPFGIIISHDAQVRGYSKLIVSISVSMNSEKLEPVLSVPT